MGLFDRIKKKHENVGKDKKPINVTDAKKSEKKPESEKKEKPIHKSEKIKVVKQNTREAYRILSGHIQTEKASRVGKLNQYVFAAPANVTKIEIAQAVVALYGVKPIKITTVKVHGKAVRFGRTKGNQKSWKKVFVKLKTGETIDTSN
ncbi:MAG: 50S ribosomal protein L23 [Patescibacteria group bacterium]|jgi:large subunit ribosomal protein L23